jgi:uncharacterized protein YndB with AHSA1/START domain/DNA-binding transcriptional ArsR family regulator
MNEEQIFKALADEHRRKLLDLLYERDGQTQSELETHLPMTRFGVMKHLQLLEDAGLITTRKIGREKFHYLNPVPIQEVYERWVSKYARPWAQTLTTLKQHLEETDMQTKPNHVMQIIIRTTPEKLWQALTDGNLTQQYYFNSRFESTLEKGAPYRYQDNGFVLIDGTIIESQPYTRLVMTFNAHFSEEAKQLPASTVTIDIQELGQTCKLTMTHSDLDMTKPITQGFINGWTEIFSSLKTLLETGEPLPLGN